MRQGTREPERLLIVGDDHEGRDLLSRRLTGRGYSVDIADDGIDALAKIRAAQYDLILLEQIMPGMSGLDLLRLLRATYSSSDLPVIMVASEDQGAPVVEALNDGANDYVTKPVNMPVVTARIQAQLARVKQERQTRENEQRIDPVTGLANRLALLEHLADRLENQTGPLSILLLDLDAFKVVNDSFGLAAGDGILCEIGVRLRDAILGSGLVARIGGDEFAVVLDGFVSDEAGVQLAERILTVVSHPIPIRGRQISIGASIGIVTSAAGAAEDLLRDADLAMYRAKELGKNRWHVFEAELRDRAQTRMVLVHDMHNAARNGQLLALYQPKVELKTRRIVGFEALLRWQHPERGILFPVSFIPLAEETGLIVPIGEWILREACWQLRRWQDRFPAPAPLTMNVNLSVRQIADAALVSRVRRILEETGIAPETLNLELTETSLMSDLETAKSVLAQLQAMRIGLKLDDFGTGYSSLAYLRALHFDCLKIDRSFVAKMMVDSESHIIVETIVKLAHALEMSVVAEGIEEETQVDELIRLGCDVGQGFYFSRPVEAPDAESQLRTSPR